MKVNTTGVITHPVVRFIIPLSLIAGYLILNIPSPISFLLDPDQGVQLAHSQMILYGSHPFVDFPGGVNGPLMWYGSALGQLFSNFRLYGEIGVIILGYTFAYSILYLLVLRITMSQLLSLISLIFLLFLMPRFYKYYIVLGPAVYLFGLYSYITFGGKKRVFFLAAATVFAGLYRFDFGAYGLITSIIAILLPHKQKRLLQQRVGELVLFALTGVILVAPWIIFLASKTSFANFLLDLNLNTTSGMALPVPRFDFTAMLSNHSLFVLLFWSFFFLPGISLSIWFLNRHALGYAEKNFIPLVCMYCQLIFIQAMHRIDIPHLMQVIYVQFVLLAWGIVIIWNCTRKETPKISKAILTGYGITILTCLTFFNQTNPATFCEKVRNLTDNYQAYFFERGKLRAYYATQLAGDEKNWAIHVVNLVHNNTQEGQPVLFIPYLPQFYYFTERSFATPTGYFFPGMQNSPEKQDRYIKSLREGQVNVVVDMPDFSYDGKPERNVHVYMEGMMKFIYEYYPIQTNIGPAVILSRQPLNQ